MSEHDEQVLFFEYVGWKAKGDHRYEPIFSVPNGSYKSASSALKFQKEGLRSGVPDIFIAYPAGKYHGMFIEMKYGKKEPTDKQWEWLRRLASNDYKCIVAYTGNDAIAALEAYLSLPSLYEEQLMPSPKEK